MDSTRATLALLVTMSVAVAGVALFVVTAEYDYPYRFDRATDERPAATIPPTWEDLDERERSIVERAIDGERFTFDTADRRPPAIVRRGETYYYFETGRRFEWTAPGTFGPLALFLAGAAGSVWVVRAEIRGRGIAGRI